MLFNGNCLQTSDGQTKDRHHIITIAHLELMAQVSSNTVFLHYNFLTLSMVIPYHIYQYLSYNETHTVVHFWQENRLLDIQILTIIVLDVPFISMYILAELKTVGILITWLLRSQLIWSFTDFK